MMRSFSTFAAKMLAVLLFLLFFSLTVLTGIGVLFLDDVNAYESSAEAVTDNMLAPSLHSDLVDISVYYHYNGKLPDGYDNLRVTIQDTKGSVLFSNLGSENFFFSGFIDIIGYNDNYEYPTDWIPGKCSTEKNNDIKSTPFLLGEIGDFGYRVIGYVLPSPENPDYYYQTYILSTLAYTYRYHVILLCAGSFLFSVLLFIFLMCAAGKRFSTQDICTRFWDKIPSDLFLAILCAAEIFFVAAFISVINQFFENYHVILLCILVFLSLCFAGMFLLLSMSIAVRVKKKTLWKNTLIYRLLHYIYILFIKIPAVWKTALIALGLILFNLFFALLAFDNYFPFGVFLYLIFLFVLFGFTVKLAFDFKQLKTAGELLSKGDAEHTIQTEKMFGVMRQHGEALNSIGSGIQSAVERQMKSERLKTELITNVSHDIKTPLTSIINYVDLLQNTSDPKEQQKYLTVLKRQSRRLKKLTEDLVEASKASTGNITAELCPLDICQLTKQAIGEYADKLEQAKLDPIITPLEPEMFVLGDGKLLWRIIDNLLSNACKYSQAGTRLYIDIWRQNHETVITFKSISKDRLNIAPEELMERFVRGDSSRNSDGSGLGLNIAKSLAEIQHGTLSLGIDGDLFRANIYIATAQKPLPKD